MQKLLTVVSYHQALRTVHNATCYNYIWPEVQ